MLYGNDGLLGFVGILCLPRYLGKIVSTETKVFYIVIHKGNWQCGQIVHPRGEFFACRSGRFGTGFIFLAGFFQGKSRPFHNKGRFALA